MRRTCLLALMTALAWSNAAAAVPAAHGWSYEGASGPDHWGGVCNSGKMQSPIDIRPAAAKHKGVPPLQFSYRPGQLQIIDNGHTIQVNAARGSVLSIDGVRFPLIQLHFHRPAEEAIDGSRADMVAHLVHGDGQGNLAVVAVPLSEGAPNPLIETLWKHLPSKKGRTEAPKGTSIDPSILLPGNRGYFTYIGSLTTPPCTEGVRWFVLKSPVTVSPEQIAAFGKLYPGNSRPIQPDGGRDVLASDE